MLDIEIKDGDIINIIVDGVEWKKCLVKEDKKGRLFAVRFYPSIKIAYLKRKKDKSTWKKLKKGNEEEKINKM